MANLEILLLVTMIKYVEDVNIHNDMNNLIEHSGGISVSYFDCNTESRMY